MSTCVCVCVCVYICPSLSTFVFIMCDYSFVKLATIVEGDPKAPFTVATSSRCKDGCYSNPLNAQSVFNNGPGDRGSIPGRIIPKTQKMVLDASSLSIQHYKLRIKCKEKQSREWSSAFPYTSV